MANTHYKRPLPKTAIAFASPEGRRLFAEAQVAGGMTGYFPLAEQFHTQSDPAYCGLGSLVMAFNALAIDPERLWKGAWRWFAEDMLDCCLPLAEIRERGLSIDELACLARCNVPLAAMRSLLLRTTVRHWDRRGVGTLRQSVASMRAAIWC